MDKQPIFIIGCPRSGTTLLRVIIDSHPNICCGPETHLIKHLEDLKYKIDKQWKNLELYGVPKDSVVKKIREIFDVFQENYVKTKNKRRWAAKTPEDIFHVDFINELFPQCKFINLIRDGRDVVSSFKRRWGRRTVFHAIKKWNESMRLTLKFREKFDKNRYLEVRYENLVSNPEEETKKIMHFLGEKWFPCLIEHHKIKHDFWFNVKKNIDFKHEKQPFRHSPSKPIFSSSVGKWKTNLNFYEKIFVKIFMKKNLKTMGYLK